MSAHVLEYQDHQILDLPASVDNSVVGVASALELSTEERDEELLVLSLVPLCVGGLGELSRGLVTVQNQSLRFKVQAIMLLTRSSIQQCWWRYHEPG